MTPELKKIDLNLYLSEINENDSLKNSIRDKYLLLKQILERSCKEITSGESLQFPSLFSRLVYIAQKYNLPKQLEWQLQSLRVKASFLRHNEQNLVSAAQYSRGLKVLELFFEYISGNIVNDELIFSKEDEEQSEKQTLSLDKIRVQVKEIDTTNHMLICRCEVLFEDDIEVKYNVESFNDAFNSTIEHIWVGAQLNLLNVKTDDEGFYIPQQFVLEPDYLIDASSMAECFQSYGSSYLHYFRRKFEAVANSHYILLGNLANFFLDELIYSQNAAELTFNEVFLKSFHHMPFEYAACKEIAANHEFKQFMEKARMHFDNIKRVVLHDLPANGFDVHNCSLEPSFFSEKYGFQGRLDLLQLDDQNQGLTRIIELKSGKPPFPPNDPTKIAPNHEAQTVIYRLMIQSVFGKDARQIYPAILYSTAANDGENLRLAASYKKLENEILNTRNRIVATEHDLYTGNDESVNDLFSEIFDARNYNTPPQFFADKLQDIEDVIEKSSTIEKAYFIRFIRFVTRELYLQKVGDEGFDSATSISSLWNSTFQERKESLELIPHLEIIRIDDSERDMKITFKRDLNDSFVNFREGEICILYPRDTDENTVLTNQILKGTVVGIQPETIDLRFRYKQRNLSFFEKHRYWAVEHDKLDHSFNAMFRGMFSFLNADCSKKNLLLGLRQPESKYIESEKVDLDKEEKREETIKKALAGEEYFLVVGPPGTGKTSIFARRLIEELYKNSGTNILVMAYTNRAVDELCASICSAFGEAEQSCNKYIRIGTEFSCGENYRHRLLQNLAHEAKNRKELNEELTQTRIFIGTLASIVGKPEMFDLKKFHVAIIDEASQILEPQIIGLLSNFDKFVMIGDHKQLSTITLQNEIHSRIEKKELNKIGIYDCRESLFERLYRVCKSNGWANAYDTLTYHGRMHEDVARFVNKHFYRDMLIPATERQLAPLYYEKFDANNQYHQLITSNRFAFIPVKTLFQTNYSDKLSESEAKEVVQLARALYDIYEMNDKDFDSKRTLGIIAPYRNQIALIKHELRHLGIPKLANVMVDTVERFQGSQRDVIIVSFCMNKAYQLQFFSNMNRDQSVDRKLNVTLTRAREQVFLVGNPNILNVNELYKKLIIHCKNSE